MKTLILPAVTLTMLLPAGINAAFAGGLDNPWERPTVTPDGTAATLNQSNRMDLCEIRARLEGWTRREIDRCESGGSDHGGGVSSPVREQGDGGTPAPSPLPDRPVTQPEPDPVTSSYIDKRTAFQRAYGQGSFADNIAAHKAQNGGNWSQEARDIHGVEGADGNWSEFGG